MARQPDQRTFVVTVPEPADVASVPTPGPDELVIFSVHCSPPNEEWDQPDEALKLRISEQSAEYCELYLKLGGVRFDCPKEMRQSTKDDICPRFLFVCTRADRDLICTEDYPQRPLDEEDEAVTAYHTKYGEYLQQEALVVPSPW